MMTFYRPVLYVKLIKVNKNNIFVFGVIYRSPSFGGEQSQNKNLLIDQSSENFCRHNVILVGDFNYSGIDWKSDTCDRSEEHVAHWA